MHSGARLKKIAQTVPMLMLLLAIPAFAQNNSRQGFFTTCDNVKLHFQECGPGGSHSIHPRLADAGGYLGTAIP